MASDLQSLREWYNEYLEYDSDTLSEDDLRVRAVYADDLDLEAIEGRIQEAMLSIHVENEFCTQCQHLVDNWPLDGYTDAESKAHEEESLRGECISHWKYKVARSSHTVEIEASARRGCKFCTYLLQVLKDRGLLLTFRKIESRLYQLGEPSTVSLSVGTMWGGSFNLWLDLPNRISTVRGGYPERGAWFSGNSKTIDESDNYTDQKLGLFDQANEWLRNCSASHDCCKADTEPFLPTRLVSLVGGQPRVVITDKMDQTSSQLQYATLSYCWGERPFIQLRADNVDALKEGLPTEDIPKTFTDAFEIASKLGIEFIWIDSLCIIQDDLNDWGNEAEKMKQVYSSSYVSISASAATNVYQGCFLTPQIFCDSFVTKVTINGREVVMEFDDYWLYDRSVLSTHLMTRAWAIQEKVLPIRIIHFGDRGILWECKTGFASGLLPNLLRRETDGLVGDVDITEPRFWHKVVKAYSAANLTYRRDKLRALAGIARAVGIQSGDEYLSGIWRKDIELHLCWRNVGPRITQKRADRKDGDWIAPTWSWASIDGGVTYKPLGANYYGDGPEPERYGHVFDQNISHSEERDYGQSSRDVLRIRCSGLVLGRLGTQESWFAYDSDCTDSAFIKHQDHEEEFPIQIDCISDSCSLEGESVYLLPLAGGPTGNSYGWPGKETTYEKDLSGIILRKTSGAVGEFCRIGSFKFYEHRNASGEPPPEDSRLAFLDIFNEVRAATEALCAEMVCNPEYPEEKYVITIV
ncbi:hypothetical protein E8E14_006855 [Neopestalotiopsis sp. 37M]|nr:hypothetical protein E8E14_006855 [Neopestalotiopsis sp. 37M]